MVPYWRILKTTWSICGIHDQPLHSRDYLKRLDLKKNLYAFLENTWVLDQDFIRLWGIEVSIINNLEKPNLIENEYLNDKLRLRRMKSWYNCKVERQW